MVDLVYDAPDPAAVSAQRDAAEASERTEAAAAVASVTASSAMGRLADALYGGDSPPAGQQPVDGDVASRLTPYDLREGLPAKMAPAGAPGGRDPAPATPATAAGTAKPGAPQQPGNEATAASAEGDSSTSGGDAYVRAPEGSQAAPGSLEAFGAAARELGVPQEAAQKLVDRMVPEIARQQQAVLDAHRGQWEEQSRSDREFGGSRFDENLALAKNALREYGTPELKRLLNETGLGSHPEVLRLLVRAGRARTGR